MSKPVISPILQAGGTLLPGRHIYIERPQDEELLRLLRNGEYVNVLSTRQMGKSSLMVRAIQKLSQEKINTAAIDLAAELTSGTDSEKWFRGLLSRLRRDFGLSSFDIGEFWTAYPNETDSQKLQRFFRDIVCSALSGPIVVFLDEIDSTLKFAFTDALFTCLRGMYNERSLCPAYKRVTFCLLGVAAPNELVKDRRTTAYNIGETLELRDFDLNDDLGPLIRALSDKPEIGKALLSRVLYWTDGQPFLTVKLCSDLQRQGAMESSSVDAYVNHAFVTLDGVSGEVHFEQILRFIQTRWSGGLETLDLYGRLLAGEKIKDQPSPAHLELKLSGLVKRDSAGQLVPHNRIYSRLFDQEWLNHMLANTTENVRKEALRRYQRRVYITAALMLASVLAIGAAIYYYWSSHSYTIEGDARSGYRISLGKIANQSSLLNALQKVPEKSVVSLDVSGSKIYDLSPLEGLTGLENLKLRAASGVGNFLSLKNLTQLRSLDLALTGFSDLALLPKSEKLNWLDLQNNGIDNVTPLESLVSLEWLNIESNRVHDLSSLAELRNLNTLNLRDNQVRNLVPLAGLTNINRLDLSRNDIVDVTPLAKLTNLENLDLSATKILNISALENLKNLTNLNLSCTNVSDLSSLRRLEKLTALDVSHSFYIDDPSALQEITSLPSLKEITFGKATEADINALKVARPWLQFSRNPSILACPFRF